MTARASRSRKRARRRTSASEPAAASSAGAGKSFATGLTAGSSAGPVSRVASWVVSPAASVLGSGLMSRLASRLASLPASRLASGRASPACSAGGLGASGVAGAAGPGARFPGGEPPLAPRQGLGDLGGLFGRRDFLLRIPFEGVGGKQGGELGQGDRLLRGVDDSFQLGFQAHSAIGTSSMVPEVEQPCLFIAPRLWPQRQEKGARQRQTARKASGNVP